MFICLKIRNNHIFLTYPAYKKGILFYDSPQGSEHPQELFIKMSNGIYHVNPGDYIIRDINGEIHTYELDDPVKLR